MGLFDSNLPWDGDKVGETLGSSWLNNLAKTENYFLEPYQEDIGSLFSNTMSGIGSTSSNDYTNTLFNMGRDVLDSNYQMKDSALKEEMGATGFGNSSSNVLMQSMLDKQYTNDLAKLMDSASLSGQNLYNNDLSTQSNLLNTAASLGSDISSYNYNLNSQMGQLYNNMLGRKTDAEFNNSERMNNLISNLSNYLQNLII